MRRITNVRLPKPIGVNIDPNLWWLLLNDEDIVLSIKRMPPDAAMSGENWGGDWLSPMGIDLQINGGFGVAFNELKFEGLPKLFDLLDQLWADGVDSICPTFVSCGVPELRRGLSVIQAARKLHSAERCELLGAHLEGPFISPTYRGAHSLGFICEPSLDELDQRIGDFEDQIALVTLAPELSGANDVINRLLKLDVVVSLGHSAADAKVARSAFDIGVGMITHTFNAMPGLHHRGPGPIAEAIKNGRIAMGLIADGVHVDPNIAVLLQRLADERLVLVSDALAPYGLGEGEYQWDTRLMNVINGTCRLVDNQILVGSTQTLLDGCRRLARWSGEPSAAIWAATISPRHVLKQGVPATEHIVGKPLKNLLRWQFNFSDFELTWHRAS